MPVLPTVTEAGPLGQAAAAAEERRALLRSKFARLRNKITEDSELGPTASTSTDGDPRLPRPSTSTSTNTSTSSTMAVTVEAAVSTVSTVMPAESDAPDSTTMQLWAQLNDALQKLQGQQTPQLKNDAFVRSLNDLTFSAGTELRRVVERFAAMPWRRAGIETEPPPLRTDARLGAGAEAPPLASSPGLRSASARPPSGTHRGSHTGTVTGERPAPSTVASADTERGQASVARPGDSGPAGVRGGRWCSSRATQGSASSRTEVSGASAGSLNDAEVAEDVVSAVLSHPRTTVSVCSASSFAGTVYYSVRTSLVRHPDS